MIVLNLQGGFGNHLFIYMLGVILADKNNMKINIIGNNITNDNLNQRADTRTTIFKIINKSYIDNVINLSNTFNIDTVEKYHTCVNMVLDKNTCYHINIIHLNDMMWFNTHLDIIFKYIMPLKVNCPSNTIVISLRLGMGPNEVAQPSPFESVLRLPFDYYRQSINYFINKNKEIDRLVILADNYTDPYLMNFQEFKDLNTVYMKDTNTLEQFKCIVSSQNFISSNSSFSLVGCLFNKTGVVIIPSFNDSNAVYPGISNSCYSKILNIDRDNVIKIKI
jgi:hypothetical protein